jgi:hypothetical protein
MNLPAFLEVKDRIIENNRVKEESEDCVMIDVSEDNEKAPVPLNHTTQTVYCPRCVGNHSYEECDKYGGRRPNQ